MFERLALEPRIQGRGLIRAIKKVSPKVLFFLENQR